MQEVRACRVRSSVSRVVSGRMMGSCMQSRRVLTCRMLRCCLAEVRAGQLPSGARERFRKVCLYRRGLQCRCLPRL